MSDVVAYRLETLGQSGRWIMWRECLTLGVAEAELDGIVKLINAGRYPSMIGARVVKVVETTEVSKEWRRE